MRKHWSRRQQGFRLSSCPLNRDYTQTYPKSNKTKQRMDRAKNLKGQDCEPLPTNVTTYHRLRIDRGLIVGKHSGKGFHEPKVAN